MKHIFTFNKIILASFLSCAAYWIYLIFFSQIGISCDAKGFEGLGSLLHTGGWIEYFKTGPHREPIYPLLISFSMRVANLLSIPYYYIQKIIQVLILFSTQLLVLVLLAKLKVNRALRVFALLYIGFSPAIVNSAFSLFSEIAVYPFVISVILINVFLWRNIHKMRYAKVIFWGIMFGLLFLGATFAKGIFHYVFIIFLAPYIFMFIRSVKNGDKKILGRVGLYVATALIIFNAFFISYKWMNFKYNGNFEFTDRYGSLLYGNAAKRAEKLTPRMFFAHLAFIPGKGVSRLFFTPEEVKYCGFETADYIRGKVANLTNYECISLARQKFLERPFQYVLFMGIEGTRMFFWESTKLGFVKYPIWLEHLFALSLFKNGLRLLISLLTIISFVWLITEVFRKRKLLCNFDSYSSEPVQIYFFTTLLIISYIGLYSLFSVVTRYALPLAPLYILSIVCFLGRNKQNIPEC